MIRQRLAANMIGDPRIVPSSDSRYKKGLGYLRYLQLWVTTGKPSDEAILFHVRLCYQVEIWILAQYQSLL